LTQLKAFRYDRTINVLYQHQRWRTLMPFESIVVAAGVVAMFVMFAMPVAWAVNRTSRKV
jgi:ABC-type Fe3+ transport system permease subunit